jgi:short-subunit dehydrogenase
VLPPDRTGTAAVNVDVRDPGANERRNAGRGTLALVTGACSGIGLEIARELARRGHNLLLVSNRESRLATASRELAGSYGVGVNTICLDLAHSNAADLLYDQVRRQGLNVEILVSNAGMFFFGEVADTNPVRAEAMLQLHVVTPSLLALHFGRDMRRRRYGHILLVSSISAWRDFPGIAYYGSSKRYLRSFAAALREELRIWGVNVTCLAPGATATDLYDQTTVPVEAAVKYGIMRQPDTVARAGVEGMLRRKAVVIPGLSGKLMAVGMKLLPQPAIRLVREHSSLLPRPGD